MDKTHILEEIKRTANANDGVPLGKQRFFSETGIRESDWCGIHWRKWSDALLEAGYAANEFNKAYPAEKLIADYAMLAAELGRLPVQADLRMKARTEPDFPSPNTFSRLGTKAERIERLADYCQGRNGYEAVLGLCEHFVNMRKTKDEQHGSHQNGDVLAGFVYLMKSGRFYKIGRSNAAGRREYELAIQLPEKLTTVHAIRTDDPAGIEAYWHNRFKDKRKNGEWFELTGADVTAFKRRKFM